MTLIASDLELDVIDSFPHDYLHAFRSLWADEGLQLAVLKGNEYAIDDNVS